MRGLLGKTKPGSWRWVLGRMRLRLRVKGPARTVIFGCHALLADSALCVSFLSCPRRRLSDPRLITRLSTRGSSHRVRTKPWSPLLLFLSRLPSVPLLAPWVRFHTPAGPLVSSYSAWRPLTVLATLRPRPSVAAHTLGVTPVTAPASLLCQRCQGPLVSFSPCPLFCVRFPLRSAHPTKTKSDRSLST